MVRSPECLVDNYFTKTTGGIQTTHLLQAFCFWIRTLTVKAFPAPCLGTVRTSTAAGQTRSGVTSIRKLGIGTNMRIFWVDHTRQTNMLVKDILLQCGWCRGGASIQGSFYGKVCPAILRHDAQALKRAKRPILTRISKHVGPALGKAGRGARFWPVQAHLCHKTRPTTGTKTTSARVR